MTARFVISDFFLRMGIREIFCVPGIHILPLIDSFISSGISVYMARCERSLIFMVDGYSRASGKIGVAVVTPGPGLANSVVGCMEAFWSQVPILILHIDIGEENKGKGVLHEVFEPEKMLMELAKATIKVMDVEDLPQALCEAFFLTKKEDPGPVLLSIPYGLLEKKTDVSEAYLSRTQEEFEKEDFIERFSKILDRKKKPIILAGWQMMQEEAKKVFEEICTEAQIPFLTTTGGKGIVDEREIYAFGNVIQKGTVRRILNEADLVIAIGTRLRDVDTKRRGVPIKELVHITQNEKWLGKNYEPCLSGVGKPEFFLNEIKNVLKGRRFCWDLSALKEAYKSEIEGLKVHTGFRIIKAIRDAIPDETVTVWDLNLISYWAEYYFPVYRQRTFFLPRGSSTIFFGLPAAVGAKIARMDKPCLSVCGDGGVLASIAEFATMVKYKIPLVLLIYNNSSFGVLESYMVKRYGISGSMSLENPDFVRLAQAFGFKAKKARNEEELYFVLKRYVGWDEPFVIEFTHPTFLSPWEI